MATKTISQKAAAKITLARKYSALAYKQMDILKKKGGWTAKNKALKKKYITLFNRYFTEAGNLYKAKKKVRRKK